MKTGTGIWIGIFLLLATSMVGAGEIGITPIPPIPTTGEVLTATVLNNGAPVSGILVSFAIDGGAPVFNMTNSQGIAIYKPLTTGNLLIKATLDGVLLASTSVPVIYQQAGYQITLSPTAPTVGNIVTATILRNGTPTPGILVNFAIDGGTPVFNMTNTQGMAIFKPLAAGNLVVKATLDGVLLATTSVAVKIPVPTGNGGDGGGGPSSSGGGGGGGGSGEKYANIDLRESYEESIFKDRLTSYKYKHIKNPIVYVNITGNVNAGLINAMTEVLKNTSTLVKTSPPGTVYKNVNIWVGTTGFSVPKNIQEGKIVFKVNKSWFTEKDIAPEDIRMVRWGDDKWNILDTTIIGADDQNTFFESTTNTFSPFSITGVKETEIIIEKPTPTVKETEIPIATISPGKVTSQGKETAGFETILAILTVSTIYIFRKKIGFRRKK